MRTHIWECLCPHRWALISKRSAAYALVLCALYPAYAFLFRSAPPLNFLQRSALISALFFCMHFDLYALIAQRSGAYALLFLPALRCGCALIFPSAPPLNRALIEPSIRAHSKNGLAPVFLEYCKEFSSCVWFFFPDFFFTHDKAIASSHPWYDNNIV